jgi:hypothetical protein
VSVSNTRNILISGFRRDVDEICGLLGNYTASCGNYLPTFQDNVSVPSPQVKSPSTDILLVASEEYTDCDGRIGKYMKIKVVAHFEVLSQRLCNCCSEYEKFRMPGNYDPPEGIPALT